MKPRVQLLFVLLFIALPFLSCSQQQQPQGKLNPEGEGVRIGRTDMKPEELDKLNAESWYCEVFHMDRCQYEGKTCLRYSEGNLGCRNGNCGQKCVGHPCPSPCKLSGSCGCSLGLCYCKKAD